MIKQTVGNITVTAELSDTNPETLTAFTDVKTKYSHLGNELKEHFYAVFLNAGNETLAEKLIGLGDAASASADVADIARTAVLVNAQAVILVHNHPSGDATPTEVDTSTTRTIRDALQLFDVALLDHVIISRNDAHSMARSHAHLFDA